MVTFLFWASQWPGHTFKVEKTNEKLILKSRHFWKVLGTQRVNKTILWSHNYLLEVIPVISVDTEAVSLCQNTNARVGKTLELINWYVLCRSFAIKVSSEHVIYDHVCHQLKGLDFHILKITSIPTFLKTMISFVFHFAMAYIFKITLLTVKKRDLFILTLCIQNPLKILHLKILQPYYLAKLTSHMNLILQKESNLTQTVVEFG